MRCSTVLLVALLLVPALASAQAAPPPVQQRGSEPNAGEVRSGTAEGDAPSASAGTLKPRPAPRVLGLPVNAALIIVGVLVVLFVAAGVMIPRARRHARARGGGTYGTSGDNGTRARRR